VPRTTGIIDIIGPEISPEYQTGHQLYIGKKVPEYAREMITILFAVFELPNRVLPIVHAGYRSAPPSSIDRTDRNNWQTYKRIVYRRIAHLARFGKAQILPDGHFPLKEFII